MVGGGGTGDLVTTREGEAPPANEYILLRPGHYPPRSGAHHGLFLKWSDIPWLVQQLESSQVVVVDFETNGTDYSRPDFRVAGIGIAWDTGSGYFQWSTLSVENRHTLLEALAAHLLLLAHNYYFDGGILYRELGKHARGAICTYTLLALLANEGYPEQGWSLKGAMVTLLGWPDTNEGELDEWLVSRGYYRGNRRKDESPEALVRGYREGTLHPEKGEMWRAPSTILGKYCLLDVEATYLLYTEILAPVKDYFVDAMDSHLRRWMYLISLLIEQRVLGIPVDRDGLAARREALLREIEEVGLAFQGHSETRAHIREMEKGWIEGDFHPKEPAKYLKGAGQPKEPRKWRVRKGVAMVGEISKAWLRWQEKVVEWGGKEPEISRNWINWRDRLDAAGRRENPDYNFNISSGPQLRELLYERLGYPIRMYSEPSVQFPEGQPGVSVKAFRAMGEVGELLVRNSYLRKELGFIEYYLEKTESRETLHPSFRTPGTVTGRLSSKEPNLQQVPKSLEVMSLLRARPGCLWVDLDFAALEAIVAAEFTQDESMLRLYGNGAPANDIHLFVAARVPQFREKILATGYDPLHPTPEALARAKKECKTERSITKTVVYACQFGAGIDKVMSTLEGDEVYLPREEVAALHKGYWDTFPGIRTFSKSLLREWRSRGGYILNGLGRPMAVPEDSTKDLLSRFIQSTGHDLLLMYIEIYTKELSRRGIPWTPLIIDLHDASTVEVPEGRAEETVEVFRWAVDELNRQVGGTILLRGAPTVGKNLAEVKEVEE